MTIRIVQGVVAGAWLLVFQGCTTFPYDDRCGPEFRISGATFTLADPYTGSVTGLVSVTEVKGDSVPGRLQLNLYGAGYGASGGSSLQGHVQRASLRDPAGGPLQEFVLQPVGQAAAASAYMPIRDPAQLELVLSHLATGDVVLEIITDIAGREVIHSAPVSSERRQDFVQAHCS